MKLFYLVTIGLDPVVASAWIARTSPGNDERGPTSTTRTLPSHIYNRGMGFTPLTQNCWVCLICLNGKLGECVSQ